MRPPRLSPFERPQDQPAVSHESAWRVWLPWAVLTIGGFWLAVWFKGY